MYDAKPSAILLCVISHAESKLNYPTCFKIPNIDKTQQTRHFAKFHAMRKIWQINQIHHKTIILAI